MELAPVDIKFDSTGTKVAATSMDNSLKIYELKNGDNLTSNLLKDSNTTEAGQTLDPWKVCFNPKNSSQVLTGQQNLQVVNLGEDFSIAAEIKHNKYINCLDFAPNGNFVASGDIDGAVKVFDSNTREMKG